ncbi:MAG: DUF1553 domain-containing protein, partial [Planctomycetaceae bacterium]|nr:DUF1553 domain-containing protein [Planctomycetaceae bacterium]
PELLDYLAGQFIEQGWSTKTLVKEIVLSDAYRRQSRLTEEAMAVDPDNRLLWRMNRKRLEAECLLDAVLAASGELDLAVSGKTVPEGLSADYEFPQASRRRALYWPQFRNSRPELLVLFDGANPSLVSGRRNVSSVAPQALYLMNSPWIIDQARTTADRLLQEEAADAGRIDSAFRLVLGRDPTDDEATAVARYLTMDGELSSADRRECWTQVIQSLFASLDFRYLY